MPQRSVRFGGHITPDTMLLENDEETAAPEAEAPEAPAADESEESEDTED